MELEITESLSMQDVDFTIKTLQKLKEEGVLISIDDFGTGHSSLNYIKKFPIDKLKVDRAFVKDITHSFEDAAIAKAIITLAKSLNLGILAEGVETIEQLEMITSLSCSVVQGYLFSRPIPRLEVETMLQNNHEYEVRKGV